MNTNYVYEFLYNDDTCESAAHTESIHRTLKGAKEAIRLHKIKTKEEYNELYSINREDYSDISDEEFEEYKKNVLEDFDPENGWKKWKWWGYRKTLIQN